MGALSFWKAVTLEKSNPRDQVFRLLNEDGIRYCVLGGQAVNAYVEPLVSLDLDLVVAVAQLDQVRKIFEGHFQTEVFPNSIHISAYGSNLRVQGQTASATAISWRAQREALDFQLPAASIE